MATFDARCLNVTGAQFYQPAEKDLTKYFDRYEMTHKKRGIAYIFNNETFKDSHLKTRYGSSKDTEDFKTALIKLGFLEDDINVYRDATAEEMLDFLKLFEKENPHIDIDCFICAILSYGGPDDLIYGYDGVVKLDELLSCLRPDRCPSLTGIPKLFFVQTCYVNNIDTGIEKYDADLLRYEERAPKGPVMADMLVVYSSCNEYPSFKHKDRSSRFMQGLSKMLAEYGNEYEIMTLLTAVSSYIMSFDFESSDNLKYSGCCETPRILSTLIKELKFQSKN